MRSRLQLQRIWSKEQLVDRASKWANRRGIRPLTVATLVHWKDEGLLPRPVVRSLGRGRGSTSGWAWTTYRRLLRLLTLRHRGVRRLSELRIAIWLDDGAGQPASIRADLEAYYRRVIVANNKELRTAGWSVRDDAAPSESARRAISSRLLSTHALERILAGFDLEPDLELPVRFALSMLEKYEGRRAATAFVHQFFATGVGDIPASLAAVRSKLPGALAPLLEGAERDWTSHVGLLAHPDGFDNPLLRGVTTASDRTLVNLRHVVVNAERSWTAGMRLITSILEVRPEVLGSMRLMQPVFVRMASKMTGFPVLRSYEARLGLLALALMSPVTRVNEGARLRDVVDALVPFAEWLADRPLVLAKLGSTDSPGLETLFAHQDLPEETRRFLAAIA